MKEMKRVYSEPDLTVMRYTPNDAVMACYSVICKIGGQEEVVSESGMSMMTGTYNGQTYVIWQYTYENMGNPGSSANTWSNAIKSIYNQWTGENLSSTMGWHIAEYDSSAATTDSSSY
ncbi:MAG: hypothetical protein LUH07_08800 [Lachnospiraceae bacterium]|nr:hypothetical protein [Lachnospiraceae bacterium]